MPALTARPRLRAAVSIIVLLAILAAIAAILPRALAARPTRMGDFTGYWAVARLLLDGAAAYDPSAVFALQRSLGWPHGYPNLVWYPPWALLVFLPFGWLPFWPGRALWLAGLALAVLLAADRLWRSGGGDPRWRWIAWWVALSFYPVLAALVWVQASPLVLVGLVGFLSHERRRQDLRAGAFLALVAIKPHLLYLFWCALLIWVVRSRRWRILAGLALAATSATLLVAAANPSFVASYVLTGWRHPPEDYMVATWGTHLRLVLGPQRFWLQLTPALAGLAWLAARARHLTDPTLDRGEALGPLLFASLIGGVFLWTPDLSVLLVALIPAALRLAGPGADARARRRPVVAYLAINVVALVLHESLHDHWFVWLPPAYAWLAWSARRPTAPSTASSSPAAEIPA